MGECCSLRNVPVFRINNRRVPCVDDASNEVRCVINFRYLLRLVKLITFFYFFFCTLLYHASAVTDEVEAGCHVVDTTLSKLHELLKLDETDGVEWAPRWYREHMVSLWQQWQWLTHI